ncbi:MAG: PilZ domain-containing protein [Deltaproteobacteria bacterium]|nr:PilZ domain-containing protein [Deltaproteobacteria bacterium]
MNRPKEYSKKEDAVSVTFHVGKNNLATLICPNCAWTKTIDATKYLGAEKKIKIKVRCRCGTTYIAVLDRRKFQRKETDLYGTFVTVHLPGTYTSVKDGHAGEALIVNLSREGLRFTTDTKALLKPNDHIRIEFHLDDRNRSRIRKRAVVKSVTDNFVGVQFTRVDPTDASDVAIGFYLLIKS